MSGPACTTTYQVPVAMAGVSIPMSLKLTALCDVDGLGLTAAKLGEGETAAVAPPDPPQAEVVAASATSATHLFMPAVSRQLCSRLYRCRLLDGDRRSASISDWQ